ncbi:MAG: glutaredoxin family protein [Deltaproteobacteria bacterium]|nr:glutaredoxin family protein [Deltaproteobacteria bacterium]
MFKFRFYSLILLLFLFAGTASAQIYKWVDENGLTHFSDRPPADAESKDNLELFPARDSKSQSETHSKPVTRTRKDVVPDSRPKVELYTTSWCIYCKKARDFFQLRGISFTEYDIEKDKHAALRKNRLDTKNGVPFAIINGYRVHGFSEADYEKALQKNP